MKSANVYTTEGIILEENLQNFKSTTKVNVNLKDENLTNEIFLNETLDGGYRYCRVVMEEIVDFIGRTGDTYFSQAIVKNEYDVFISIRDRRLICMAGKKSVDRIKKLFEEMLKVEFNLHSFNLEEITNNSSNIKKAKFSDLTIQTLTSSILQGNRINETEIFIELIENGEIRNITALYPFGNKDVSFLVSQGSILLYTALTKEEYLRLICELISLV